jgi:hypothetical protein
MYSFKAMFKLRLMLGFHCLNETMNNKVNEIASLSTMTLSSHLINGS